MNTDMNKYLILRYASPVVRKMTTNQVCCAGLARSPFVLTEHMTGKNFITSLLSNIAQLRVLHSYWQHSR